MGVPLFFFSGGGGGGGGVVGGGQRTYYFPPIRYDYELLREYPLTGTLSVFRHFVL